MDLREQQATFTSIEGRPLADGDFAQASLDGVPKDGDEEASPSTWTKCWLKSAAKTPCPNSRRICAEHQPVMSAHLMSNYPADSQDQRLAGKTFTYTVKVQAMKQKSLPELNDQFAKELGEFATSMKCASGFARAWNPSGSMTAEREAKDKLMAELVKRNEFEVPEALVEHQIDVRLERGLRALAAQGMKAEDIKKMDFARSARRSAGAGRAGSEGIAAAGKDCGGRENRGQRRGNGKAKLKRWRNSRNRRAEAIRARLTQDGALDRIRNRIRNEKTLDFLYQQSA